jgi:predicted nucleic acid-binding protein
VIHLDTSFLIRAGIRGTAESDRLRSWLSRRTSVRISAVVWAEFLCGPVTVTAMEAAAEMLGAPCALTGVDATLAAHLFNASGRRRGTLADCLIAATAINARASLATSNENDFTRFERHGLVVESV